MIIGIRSYKKNKNARTIASKGHPLKNHPIHDSKRSIEGRGHQGSPWSIKAHGVCLKEWVSQELVSLKKMTPYETNKNGPISPSEGKWIDIWTSGPTTRSREVRGHHERLKMKSIIIFPLEKRRDVIHHRVTRPYG